MTAQPLLIIIWFCEGWLLTLNCINPPLIMSSYLKLSQFFFILPSFISFFSFLSYLLSFFCLFVLFCFWRALLSSFINKHCRSKILKSHPKQFWDFRKMTASKKILFMLWFEANSIKHKCSVCSTVPICIIILYFGVTI